MHHVMPDHSNVFAVRDLVGNDVMCLSINAAKSNAPEMRLFKSNLFISFGFSHNSFFDLYFLPFLSLPIFQKPIYLIVIDYSH